MAGLAVNTGINREAIDRAIHDLPLCREALHRRDEKGRTKARCVVGWLLWCAGITDVSLRALERDQCAGDEDVIWSRFGKQLRARYGFMSARQVGALMDVNDAAPETQRYAFVMSEVDRMVKSGWR